MSEQPHTGATFLASMFGPSTGDPVFVCSLLNNEAKGTETINERFVTTRNTDDIAGFARNDPDGTVAAFAQGEDAAVDDFIAWCRRGPSGAC